MDFYKKLVEYFENTPREKVLEDWAKTEEFDEIGPTVDEFLNVYSPKTYIKKGYQLIKPHPHMKSVGIVFMLESEPNGFKHISDDDNCMFNPGYISHKILCDKEFFKPVTIEIKITEK
jgi:hypothetical protein